MILRAEELSKAFSGFQAVNKVSLNLGKGQIVSIIGPNGAGKTTLFNLLTGRSKADRGRVFFKDRNITDLSPHEINLLGVARSFQRTNIFPRLSTFDNVQVAVMSWKQKSGKIFLRADRILKTETEEILASVGLVDKKEMRAGFLSHGDQRRLEIGIALGSNPELLLLDEPTAGMGPEESAKAVDLIQKIVRDRGLTLLFIEHDMNIVFKISERIIVMYMGQILTEGNPESVRANPEVQRIYLAEEA